MKRCASAIMVSVLMICIGGLSLAAEPPELINYEGVLRDSSGTPLDRPFPMQFRFYSKVTGGNLLLTDSHAAVVVSDGLFNVALGSGTITPGLLNTLNEVFAKESTVWLEIEVHGETLIPRVRMLAAPYALNAGTLGGKPRTGFLDTGTTAQTKSGQLTVSAGAIYGVEAYGTQAGGYFEDRDGSGYARVGYGNRGISAFGNNAGGFFVDSDDLGYALVGSGDLGIEAYGAQSGGYFTDVNGTGYAHVGTGNRGIEGHGSDMGGYFEDTGNTSHANVAYGNRGIEAFGTQTGGYFEETAGSGYGYIGHVDRGVYAQGDYAGGHFEESDGSGLAYLGTFDRGIQAEGNDVGGLFTDADNSGRAWVGWGDAGIFAEGNNWGGYFEDRDESGYAYVGYGDWGIAAGGSEWGSGFSDTDHGTWTHVAVGSSKLESNGSGSSFVQNHPERSDEVIVYTAPEGGETATYTRGTARLVNGAARVSLGETFKWVTNPDIGLTAYVTPIGAWSDLYVESKSTSEIVVRARDREAADVVFDYMVYGLRVGFEQLPIVREKTIEAYLPRVTAAETYERRPDLRVHNALERFKTMRRERGEEADVDLSGATALRSAIGVYDPEIHGEERPESPEPSSVDAEVEVEASADDEALRPAPPAAERVASAGTEPRAKARQVEATVERTRYPVSEPVEIGDVVTLDRERPGHLRRASAAADPAVFGIAARDAEVVDDDAHVELVESRYAVVKADASYGAIMAGDLLVASPTPGHVMRAIAPLPGTMVGKAADSLDAGTGLIKVLVMLR